MEARDRFSLSRVTFAELCLKYLGERANEKRSYAVSRRIPGVESPVS